MIADQSKSPISPPNKSHVVLIHGLAGHRMVLWPLSRQLRKAGFSTSTFGYPSWWWSIEHHARRLQQHLTRINQDRAVEKFHIVAHSMGCIVTRQAILETRFDKLERIVMLAAPNQGSPVATLIGTVFPFCKTVRQVSNRQGSFVRSLPEPDHAEIGIVSASYDWVIPEPNSHLAAESDHISLFSGHNGLLVRPVAARQVTQFLNHGQFKRTA